MDSKAVQAQRRDKRDFEAGFKGQSMARQERSAKFGQIRYYQVSRFEPCSNYRVKSYLITIGYVILFAWE